MPLRASANHGTCSISASTPVSVTGKERDNRVLPTPKVPPLPTLYREILLTTPRSHDAHQLNLPLSLSLWYPKARK